MKLIEENYIPKTLDQIIVPNPKEFMENIEFSIENNKNVLFIGSISTFKIHAMKLYIKEYYSKKNCEHYNEFVLTIDPFKDITFCNETNELKTFCKTSTVYPKCVFIDNFDIISETNQQYFKNLMESSLNVFFLFGCENTTKINEIIQTRMNPVYFMDLTVKEYRILVNQIMEGENITIKNVDDLLNYSNLTIYSIYNLFNKFKLLELSHIEDILPYITLIDNTILDKYFDFVSKDNLKKATEQLFSLYDTGYSLLDIYHFLYDYLRNKKELRGINYLYIKKICYYIQYIYNGYDNKLMILFFTNELLGIYKTKSDLY
jgi:DNA polymerase III delta prime subunit